MSLSKPTEVKRSAMRRDVMGSLGADLRSWRA